jgi:hypothetical protein
MPYRKDSNTGQTGTAPNQFAQVGMGGSLGGGQFEQGEGQSGSLQSGQGGTTPDQEMYGSDTDGTASRGAGSEGDFAQQSGGQQQQQQNQSREQRSPGASDEDEELGTGRDDGMSREDQRGGSGV